jgi:outer membrane protein assembly factor BamB
MASFAMELSFAHLKTGLGIAGAAAARLLKNRTGCFVVAALLFCLAATGVPGQMAGTKLWDYTAAGRLNASPALAADGTIYAGSGNTLQAVNPDGTAKWHFIAGGPIFSSPAVGLDGTIYFGCFDNKLYALKPTGALKWAYTTGGRIYSSPAVDGTNAIYVGSDDFNLYAISMTGTQKWAFATSGVIRSSPVIAANGSIIFGSWDRSVYSLNVDGNQNWKFTTGHYVYSSAAIAPDGTIYIGSVDNRLYALNPDGVKKWDFETDSHIYSSPAIGADGTIYVGSWDNRLYAITPKGAQKWSLVTGNLVQSSPAVAADGTIYCGSDENKLYAVGPDGDKKWAYATASLVRSSPVIGSDGTIYVGSEDSKLYAFKGGSGPAASSWPMFRGDARHRGKVQLLITHEPENQVVVVGHAASFSAAASGAGPLHYQWRLNGTNLANAGLTNLTLTNVASQHAGEYTLVVSNGVETVTSAPANLTVIVPPEIVQAPEAQTAVSGAAVTFRISANSLGPLTYRWLFNGTNLPGALSPNFMVPAALDNSAGDYSVVVANAAGSITSAVARLIVVLPPQITKQPEAFVGAVGANASFSVMATSSVAVTYQWRFNGTNLAGATATNLVVNNIQPSNAGNYSVVVANQAGSVASAPASLTVDLPPYVTAQPRSQSGIVGGRVTFNVAAQSAGPLYYQWLRSGTNLPGANAAELVCTNVTRDMAGSYAVIVRNVAGAITSAPVTLTVLSPPMIANAPLTQTGAIGGNITLRVSANGTPPLRYFWFFKGKPLPGETNTVLEIPRLTSESAGAYTAVVTNTAGSVTSQVATLSLPANPSIWERIKGWF